MILALSLHVVDLICLFSAFAIKIKVFRAPSKMAYVIIHIIRATEIVHFHCSIGSPPFPHLLLNPIECLRNKFLSPGISLSLSFKICRLDESARNKKFVKLEMLAKGLSSSFWCSSVHKQQFSGGECSE